MSETSDSGSQQRTAFKFLALFVNGIDGKYIIEYNVRRCGGHSWYLSLGIPNQSEGPHLGRSTSDHILSLNFAIIAVTSVGILITSLIIRRYRPQALFSSISRLVEPRFIQTFVLYNERTALREIPTPLLFLSASEWDEGSRKG